MPLVSLILPLILALDQMPMGPRMDRNPYKQQLSPTASAFLPAVTHGTKYVMMQMPQLLKQPNRPLPHSPIVVLSLVSQGGEKVNKVN
jgi:hypothetical protein